MTETKTVQVPVTHEEVTLETRTPSGETKAQQPVSSKENITIPVKKEEAAVTKTPYVKEEVVVKKDAHNSNKRSIRRDTSEKINASNIE